jgi:hypothetical protein
LTKCCFQIEKWAWSSIILIWFNVQISVFIYKCVWYAEKWDMQWRSFYIGNRKIHSPIVMTVGSMVTYFSYW